MKILKTLVLTAMLSGIVLGQVPQFYNPFAGISSPETGPMKVGAWTKYKITSAKPEEEHSPSTLKLSLVGEEKTKGQNLFWFEIDMTDQNGDRDIIKYLTKLDELNTQKGYMSIIFKHNDEPAVEYEFEIPEEQPEYQAETTYSNETSKERKQETSTPNFTVDEQTITVPAGTFKCKHFVTVNEENGEKTEVWVSSKVPLMGIVKMVSDDGEMVLTAYDTKGAKSAITETPKKINMTQMMHQMFTPPPQPPDQEEGDDDEDIMDDAIKNGLKSIFGR